MKFADDKSAGTIAAQVEGADSEDAKKGGSSKAEHKARADKLIDTLKQFSRVIGRETIFMTGQRTTIIARDFFDTNILVYGSDGREPEKQSVARGLIRYALENDTGVLSAQVLGEFFNTVTRRIPQPLTTVAAQRVSLHGYDGSFSEVSKYALTGVFARRYTIMQIPWWFERGGPTRSHPEHGSETLQRRRYCTCKGVGK